MATGTSPISLAVVNPRTIITECNKQKVDVLINEDLRVTGKSLGTA
jgi:hypothetical protein